MFYKATLHLHNLTWWIILFTGLWTIFRVWRGHLARLAWTRHERLAGLVFSSALATQLLDRPGVVFSESGGAPVICGGAGRTGHDLLRPDPSPDDVHVRGLGAGRLFGLEAAGDDRRKYRMAVICYTAALVVLLLAVPWPFMSYGRSLLP